MAALFADFKLTQTTDMKNMLKNAAQSNTPSNSSSGSSGKKGPASHSSPDSLNGSRNVSLKKGKQQMKEETLGEEIYQTMPQPRPVSATLEDSLGYLP